MSTICQTFNAFGYSGLFVVVCAVVGVVTISLAVGTGAAYAFRAAHRFVHGGAP